MKKLIFILCVILVLLLIVWLVGRASRQTVPSGNGYQASTREEKITIYDINDCGAD